MQAKTTEMTKRSDIHMVTEYPNIPREPITIEEYFVLVNKAAEGCINYIRKRGWTPSECKIANVGYSSAAVYGYRMETDEEFGKRMELRKKIEERLQKKRAALEEAKRKKELLEQERLKDPEYKEFVEAKDKYNKLKKKFEKKGSDGKTTKKN